MKRVELLSPAKDLAIGMAAIQNGADAVYIGAPAFGARKAAANSIADIAELVRYAHRFYCRVFVALNTILYDHELAEAEKMIRQLYGIGVDALIVQDPGILRLDLPPVCLHASTQMHNYDLDRIKFLDQVGFQRIVLARELSLEQIREIRKEVKAELEVFVHGALCVSLSGQCYLSQHMFGRSANRGECAQPCRMKWSVSDQSGKVILDNKYILSLKDLNASSFIKDLIDAGVDSFKIEGRLKDENYVANVTHYYSSLIDKFPEVKRIGSGKSVVSFKAAPERSFNRGYSTYFLEGRPSGLVNPDSPKSMGMYIGRVLQTKGNRICVEGEETINNGDGLCYLDGGELKGIRVNHADGKWLVCNEVVKIKAGTELYRNYDRCFILQVEKMKSVRKIAIRMEVNVVGRHLEIGCTDEDGNRVVVRSEEAFDDANQVGQCERLVQQLKKCGESNYVCEGVEYVGEKVLFVPAVAANALRRRILEELERLREEKRERLLPGKEDKRAVYPVPADWRLNVVNRNARAFYAEHGVGEVEAGFEKSRISKGRDLMHSRYCILHELGRCRKFHRNADIQFPLFLFNAKHRFLLEFDCKECFMKIKGS